MAILTDPQIDQMWRECYQLGRGKEEIKANRNPSDSERRAIFQALEDFWLNNRAALKAGMDIAASRTLTVQEARVYARAWLLSRIGRE